MIFGAHVVIYSNNAEADRAFFSDILGLKSVDAGHGWLIFALPPAEAAFHPSGENGVHELFLMCDDLKAEIAGLAQKKVECSEIRKARWDSLTKMRLPGGALARLVLTPSGAAVSLASWLARNYWCIETNSPPRKIPRESKYWRCGVSCASPSPESGLRSG